MTLTSAVVYLFILNGEETYLVWERSMARLDAIILAHFFFSYIMINLFLLFLAKVIKMKLKPKKEEGILFWSTYVTGALTAITALCLIFSQFFLGVIFLAIGIVLLLYGLIQEFSGAKIEY